jgi:hypothetical protein
MDTAVAEHIYRLEYRTNERPGNHPAGVEQHRYVCSCEFATTWWDTRIHKNPQERPGQCPHDPTVRALTTLQFAAGGLFDATPTDHLIHLVRSTNGGTPGPTLCLIDRFAKDSAGWSVGGGFSGGPIVLKPCDGCAEVARTEFPGVPVAGSVGGRQMAEYLGVEHSQFPWNRS